LTPTMHSTLLLKGVFQAINDCAARLSHRLPTLRLKLGSCSIEVENLNGSQTTQKESSKEAASFYIMVFNLCRSTEFEQDPIEVHNRGVTWFPFLRLLYKN